jgi:hypothetical protein
MPTNHDTHGPCQAAEESITKPLKQAIEERAVTQRWSRRSRGSPSGRHRQEGVAADGLIGLVVS